MELFNALSSAQWRSINTIRHGFTKNYRDFYKNLFCNMNYEKKQKFKEIEKSWRKIYERCSQHLCYTRLGESENDVLIMDKAMNKDIEYYRENAPTPLPDEVEGARQLLEHVHKEYVATIERKHINNPKNDKDILKYFHECIKVLR